MQKKYHKTYILLYFMCPNKNIGFPKENLPVLSVLSVPTDRKDRKGLRDRLGQEGKPCVVALPSKMVFEGRATTQGFPEENLPGIPSLPFSAFFCLFRRKRMKKAEKG